MNEFLSERPIPVAPGTFAMGTLLNELNGVATVSSSRGMAVCCVLFCEVDCG